MQCSKSGRRRPGPSGRSRVSARRGARLRVLTTAYLGATEGRALDALAQMGADVRVSYDTRRARLHAKAWLFHRDTGYSTAYITGFKNK